MTLDAIRDEALSANRCIQHSGTTCSGAVRFRMPLSGTGASFPRCEGHWGARLDLEEQLSRRYPSVQPDDFDPLFAGEQWYED